MVAKKVLVMRSNGLADDGWDELAKKHGIEVVHSTAKSKQEHLDYFKNNDIVAIANTVPGSIDMGGNTDDVLNQLPSGVKVIAHQGAGYDSVGNLDILKKKGVQVSNTPNAVVDSTADTALYLILGCLRDFNGLSTGLRKGQWSKRPLADEPYDKVLGILGLGGIGAAIRDKCKGAFGFSKIQYHNRRRVAPAVEKDSKYVSFDELLATSDVLVVCVPLNDNTHHLIDAKALDKCKDGVVVVNIGRGPIIDEQALVGALESGKVRSAGLDVYEFEPKVHPKLIENDTVLLLPHAGTHAAYTRRKMELEVVKNLDEYLSTGKLRNPVPETQ